MNTIGYEPLANVLHRAYHQAAHGKGKERHARGEPFTQQVMLEGARRFGRGALLYQAYKKAEESQRLPADRAVAELLGAIVYLAGAVIVIEEEAAAAALKAEAEVPVMACCGDAANCRVDCVQRAQHLQHQALSTRPAPKIIDEAVRTFEGAMREFEDTHN